jgi:hypothetical protein
MSQFSTEWIISPVNHLGSLLIRFLGGPAKNWGLVIDSFVSFGSLLYFVSSASRWEVNLLRLTQAGHILFYFFDFSPFKGLMSKTLLWLVGRVLVLAGSLDLVSVYLELRFYFREVS